ncbi:MAG TPA: DUF58 domain-containing protein [Bacillus sp. (in: firmicutes)]|uniref:DUF58 domain-containing protein n=1 Tax=Bacillus litorisediminis TaxID=2922713 RepID=UPI001FADAF2A|nr:DUF58 domain-containing protein [Bacillus litorisediminis]HWO77099.1 DUF58 domain-containing protein [Bacillus sp. (in: firmicutes)]
MKKWKPYFFTFGKLFILLFLSAIVFSYAMFQGGFVSWFLFYSFLPFALYSFILVFYPIRDFKVERVISHKERLAGESLPIRLIITRSIPVPLFYLIMEEQVSEKTSKRFNHTSLKSLVFPGFRKHIEVAFTIHHIPRGEHEFTGIRMKVGDVLGLIEKEVIIPCENKVLVYPAYEDMIYRPVEHQYEQGTTSSNVKVQRDTSMAIGVRDYQPGDRFSWINWKATAKKNEIMTKEFEQRRSHDVMIILDRTPSNHFERVVNYASSLTRAILKKGAQCGITSVGKERTIIPIRAGESHLQAIQFHLAKVEADCEQSFHQVLESERVRLLQMPILMVLTSHIHQGLIDEMRKLTLRNAQVFLFVIKGKNEKLSAQEADLRIQGTRSGLWIRFVHEGEFSESFVGVRRS